MENLKPETSVDIKRSDGRVVSTFRFENLCLLNWFCIKGRIHGAKITAISIETTTVTVEWFENGENKGKEIDYEQLLVLNPHLLTLAENDDDVENNLNSVSNSRERLLSDAENKKKVFC